MSLFTLAQTQQIITIKNKKRISLIVPYKSTQLVIFYQDASYEHRQVFGNGVLHEGRLNCVMTELVRQDLQSVGIGGNSGDNKQKGAGYLCLIGRREECVYFGLLNIESKLYQPYEAFFHQTKIQCEAPNYHSIVNTISNYPLLVEISRNVQNGIMIKCFDFRRRQWLNQILYCGSKYLDYHFVAVPLGMFGQGKSSCFCLVANGQKFQSLHVSCISIVQNQQHNQTSSYSQGNSFSLQSQQSSIISVDQSRNFMKFNFIKQLKYYKNFTILGAHITFDGYLFLVGNSTAFQTKEKKNILCQATSMYLNFLNFSDELDTGYKFFVMMNFNLGKEIIIREYLGYFQNSMLFIIENPINRSIHRLSPSKILAKSLHYDEWLYTFPVSKVVHPQICLDFHGLVSYELVCEQFFEKIKDSPSVIKLNFLLKVSKKMYYKQILERVCPEMKNDQGFVKMVLSCF